MPYQIFAVILFLFYDFAIVYNTKTILYIKKGDTMKLKWDDPNIIKALISLSVICISIIFFFLAKNIGDVFDKLAFVFVILRPFLWGFLLAYILVRPLNFFEKLLGNTIFKNNNNKTIKRAISIIIVLLVAFILLYLLSSFVLPQILDSIGTLSTNLQSYISKLQSMASHAAKEIGNSNIERIIQSLLDKASVISERLISTLLPSIFNLSISLTSKLMNMVLIFAVTIYVLFDKEKFCMQLKKLSYAFMPEKNIKKLQEIITLIDDTFGRYINGQLTDAVVVGTLCTLSMKALGLNYAVLIGVIVACTNVIPMVGPIIGAIPGIFIILMADGPSQALLFSALILVIQQIDGNILVPRIVGSSTGLSGFWVLFAVFVSGGLFGITGIIVCVPTLSVLFKLLTLFVENRLRQKHLPTETSAYSAASPFSDSEEE